VTVKVYPTVVHCYFDVLRGYEYMIRKRIHGVARDLRVGSLRSQSGLKIVRNAFYAINPLAALSAMSFSQ
jgi:hypothetical protein